MRRVRPGSGIAGSRPHDGPDLFAVDQFGYDGALVVDQTVQISPSGMSLSESSDTKLSSWVSMRVALMTAHRSSGPRG